jgi:trk system potassium uptake protein TrkH
LAHNSPTKKKAHKAGGKSARIAAPQIIAPHYVPFFRIILSGFVYLTVIGGVLLAMPFVSADGDFTSPVDSFFTAMSAISATGLVVVDTAHHWNSLGQLIIMALIQVGGIGFMAISAFLLLMLRQRVNVGDSLVTDSVGAMEPKRFAEFVTLVIVGTLIIEAAGIVFIYITMPDQSGVSRVWQSFFYGISAFNNAGFDLEGSFVGLMGFEGNLSFLGALSLMFILGGLGVPLLLNVITRIPWMSWNLDTKMSLTTTLALLLAGTGALFLVDLATSAGNTISDAPQKGMNAFFIASSARTAGFSTLDFGVMTLQPILFVMALMFIGGVSGSTAGGIKVNTFSTVVLTAVSYLRGYRQVHAFGKVIPETQVHKAITVVFLAVCSIFVVTLILTITEEAAFIRLLFEAISALTTTGFSMALTPNLSDAGKVVIIFAMFLGRLGPLTAVLALTHRQQVVPEPEEPEEAIRIG